MKNSIIIAFFCFHISLFLQAAEDLPERPFLDLNSSTGKNLIKILVTSDYPENLPPCRLKGHYRFDKVAEDSSLLLKISKDAQGVYVLSFDLKNPEDRQLFLSPRFAGEGKDISVNSLNVENLLADEEEDTQLIRAIQKLSRYSAQLTAKLTLEKHLELAAESSSKKRVKIEQNEEKLIKKFSLQMEYIVSRLYFDEPGKGFLVIQKDGDFFYLRGLGWYCPFTTWSAGFKWNELKNNEEMQDFLSQMKMIENEEDQSTTFPQLAELSILCGSGCGSDILKIIQQTVLIEKDEQGAYLYKALITDAKETVIDFYKNCFKFLPVEATALYKQAKREVLIKCAYRHWFSSCTNVKEGDPAHLYIARIFEEAHERLLYETEPEKMEQLKVLAGLKGKIAPVKVFALKMTRRFASQAFSGGGKKR